MGGGGVADDVGARRSRLGDGRRPMFSRLGLVRRFCSLFGGGREPSLKPGGGGPWLKAPLRGDGGGLPPSSEGRPRVMMAGSRIFGMDGGPG